MGLFTRNSKKVIVGFIGWTVILIGLILVPFPGPGWVIVFVGFTILAREFDWAQDMKEWAEGKYDSWRKWYIRQTTSVQLVFALLTFLTGAVIVWLVNGYGVLDTLLKLDVDWLHSPFFK